jgi:VanZ family protein
VLPALLWAALIFVASSRPDLPHASQPLLDLLARKGAHITEYAVLAVLIRYALGPGQPGRLRGQLIVAWTLTALYAVSDEIHQSFVPGRTPAALDVAIDGAGALLGLLVQQAIRRTPEGTAALAARRAPVQSTRG